MKSLTETLKDLRSQIDELLSVAKGDLDGAVILSGVATQAGACATGDGKLVHLWSKGVDVDLLGNVDEIQKMFGKYSVTVIFRKID